MVFGDLTGVDPRTLGRGERAADELGLSEEQAVALQRVAAEQLAAGGDDRRSEKASLCPPMMRGRRVS